MAYPKEIILELIEKFQLSSEVQENFTELLLVPVLQAQIESGAFLPEDLLISLKSHLYYSPISALIRMIGDHFRDALREIKIYADTFPEIMVAYLALREKVRRIEMLKVSKPLERTEKKILLREASDELEAIYDVISQNRFLCLEIAMLSRSFSSRLNSELRWLEKQAVTYFQQKFDREGKRIKEYSFLSKVDGVQMGNRMRILYLDSIGAEHQIVYYIKTHQHGSLRAGGSTTAPVDLKELFFYKFLEYSGFGPKADFFFNPLSPTAFFIATQDESFTKAPSKLKFFKTCGQVQDDPGVLWENPDLVQALKIGILRGDILLRIFNLWDITTNTGNYGQVFINRQRAKWRIIDFRVETRSSYIVPSLFDDFLNGKGMVGYLGYQKQVLQDIHMTERAALSAEVISEFLEGKSSQSREVRKSNLLEAMDRAKDFLLSFVSEHGDALMLDREVVVADILQYTHDVKENFHAFVDGLSSEVASFKVTHNP